MKYIASFKTSKQISPDEYRTVHPTMEIKETTTVKEIIDFYNKNNNDPDYTEISIIQVFEFEQPKEDKFIHSGDDDLPW